MSEDVESRCLFCEDQQDLEKHHVVPRKLGGTDELENLITVCSSCHKKIERTWDARFYRRLGVRAGLSPDMMFDCLKEARFVLMQTQSALEGAYQLHDELFKHVRNGTIDDYGGELSRRQVFAIKREAYKELLNGDAIPGANLPLDKIEELTDQSFRVLEDIKEDLGK